MIILYSESMLFEADVIVQVNDVHKVSDLIGCTQSLPLGGFEWIFYMGF